MPVIGTTVQTWPSHRPITLLLAGTITSPREESPPESPPIAYTLPGPAAAA